MFSLLAISLQVNGQERYQAFTVNNGLPSNYIYRCVEDDKGFLWVCTDAGLARFDGKYFQLFTTQQGLPDNEVLQVVKDTDGTVWVNCFKQSPCYFDEKQNRFINAREDKDLARISGTANMNLYLLKGGGVVFANEKGCFVFRKRKLVLYDSNFILNMYSDGSYLRWTRRWNKAKQEFGDRLQLFKNGRAIDSTAEFNISSNVSTPAINDGKFYIFNSYKGSCDVYSDMQVNPIRFRKDSLQVSRGYIGFGFTRNKFYIITDSAKIFIYNNQTLEREQVMSGEYLPNGYYNDSKGNIWVSTIEKGLLLYPKKQLGSIEIPSGFNRTSFISIACAPRGNILAGNYYGEVIETGKQGFSVHRVIEKAPSRQRKILLSGKNIFTISEDGVYMNYTRPVMNPARPNEIQVAKTGIVYNDSLIIVGTFAGVLEMNSITGKVTRTVRYKRAIALASCNNGAVYMGSTDGLHKYMPADGSFINLTGRHPLFGEKIAALCATPDGLLWIATSGSGVIAVRNDSVLVNITSKDGIISNVCRSIAPGKNGQVWLGTTQGISIISYQHQHPGSFSVQNLSANDGLTSNQVNEMVYHNDTMYAATGNGISVIPAGIILARFDIPVHLVRMSINQRDTIINTAYNLNYDQQNIQMQFAGIELNGHFKHLQYNLDNNLNWTDLPENALTIQLSSGKHQLEVRATDVNGNIGDKILIIRFDIATPFWKTIWFWIIMMIPLQIIIIYLVNRRQKRRKEKKMAQAIAGVQTASLEQQAFTSLMNPHFMFNALNSIQHYINVQDRQNANRYLSDFASLIRKNFEAAQHSFISLEQEIENLKIYLRLEQMRFTNRFTYHVNTDESVEADEWMIPAMMLQPILENAILHGIMPSAHQGKLEISIKEIDKSLRITITDNGIGIHNSHVLKQNSNHKSRGMELIQKRIAALSRFVARPIIYEMTNAFDDDKCPGTRVILTIPAGLYESWLKAKASV